MSLKDKEKRKDAARDRQRKHRQGVTQEGVTGQGVTRIKQVLNDDDLIKGIEAASLRFKDREARYERAYRYNQWKAGKEIAPAVPYALVYDRDKLEKVYESLKAFRQEEHVYYGYPGLGGMPFDMVGECLEATR